MSSLFPKLSRAVGLTLWLAALVCGFAAHAEPERRLRICADPNNLPFSNDRLEGFENRIAELLADELKSAVDYTWWAQRRGFIRNTLSAGSCDLVLGLPAGFEKAATTRPYYRSVYVFVQRKDDAHRVLSFDDPALHSLKVGVHLIGDDYANTPPAHVLARRGIINNVVGFPIYGDYSKPNPPARILEALAERQIDVAIVWGPLAGYFAQRSATPLEITPVSRSDDPASPPFAYDIAMGVRQRDTAFKTELDEILTRRRADIQEILTAYGMPLLEGADDGAEAKR